MAAARLNLSMDESAEKGKKLVEGKGSDAAVSCDIGRISVKGYDTGRCRKDVKRELKKLYSSCGEITDICIPPAINKRKTLWRCAFIYFVGEGAVDKALQLNGTDMGGWTVFAQELPFPPNANRYAGFAVEGYDTSLSDSVIKRQFSKLFSSCGNVDDARIFKSISSSLVFVEGENIFETGPKLSGSKIGGRKLVVRLVTRPGKSTSHPRRLKGRGLGGRTDIKVKMTLE